MASFNAACVGGSFSDWGCFLRNRNHLISFTLEMFVFGWYNWQTNFSIAAMVLDVGCTIVPRFASAVTLSSSASRNAFQHPNFPLHAKLPVILAPLQAWNPGRAAVLAGPRAWTMGLRSILRWRCPLPVTKDVFWHDSGNLLRANRKTSVSGEMISILVAPEVVASIACNNSFVSASSWPRGGGGELGSIFAGYVPLASPNPYPIIVYSVANHRPHLSHFWANIIFAIPT